MIVGALRGFPDLLHMAGPGVMRNQVPANP